MSHKSFVKCVFLREWLEESSNIEKDRIFINDTDVAETNLVKLRE